MKCSRARPAQCMVDTRACFVDPNYTFKASGSDVDADVILHNICLSQFCAFKVLESFITQAVVRRSYWKGVVVCALYGQSPNHTKAGSKMRVRLLGNDDLDTGKVLPINALPQLTKKNPLGKARINTSNQLTGVLTKPPINHLHTSTSHPPRCTCLVAI